MARIRINVAIFVVATVPSLDSSFADTTKSDEPASVYIVVPVQTDLQRLAIGRHDAIEYVLIDGDSYAHEHFTPADLQFDKLARELRSLSNKKGALYFHIRRTHAGRIFHHNLPGGVQALSTTQDGEATSADHVTQLLTYALKGLGHELGFTATIAQSSTHLIDEESPEWEDIYRDLRQEKGNNTEEPVGNDTVRVYPVRTALSRLIFNDADCVLRIVPPLSEITAIQTQGISSRLPDYLIRLDLKRRTRLTVISSSDGQIDATVHSYVFDPKTYTRQLGFSDVAWRVRGWQTNASPGLPVSSTTRTGTPWTSVGSSMR